MRSGAPGVPATPSRDLPATRPERARRPAGAKQLALLAVATILAACHPRSTPPAPAAPLAAAAALPADLPLWAYGYRTRPTAIVDYRSKCLSGPATQCLRPTGPKEPLDTVRRAKGARRTFTLGQVWDSYAPADWFPQDHPPMPPIVGHGRRSAGVYPCALCHLPNGMGVMQNGAIAGLPKAYILQQLRDFRAGRRHSADVNKANAYTMAAIARDLTDDEMNAAADYFSAIKPRRWNRVVESAVTPEFKASTNGLFTRAGDHQEALGRRLIEMPEDTYETATLRNPRSGYVDYAPIGSLKRGKLLVTTGSDASESQPKLTTACVDCHGADLHGAGVAPPLAGRPPSYLARQLFDLKVGSRRGAQAAAMAPVVQKLTPDDFIDIVAYLAALKP